MEVDAGLEPGHDTVVMLATNGALSGSEGERDPKLSVLGITEVARHNADDGVGRFVESDVAAQKRCIGPEFGGPERMTENYDVLVSGLIFTFSDRAAKHRRDLQSGEEFGRDSASTQRL